MADDRIEILIKAVDEASSTLKNIEKQVTSTAKNSEKANQSLSSSFSQVQGAMLNLGQIAQGVHNIFETGERATRNLENAQDRLENATLRLKGANQDLTDSYKKLIDIEKKHERDSLTLDQAQLDLEEATNNLKITVNKYGEKSLEARQATIDLKNAELDLKDAQGLAKQKTDELAQAQQDIRDKQDALTIASNNVDRATRGLAKATGDAKWAYVDMGVQVLAVAGNMATFASSLPAITAALTGTTAATTGATAALGTAGLMGALSPLVALAAAGGILIPIGFVVHGMAEGAKAYEGAFGGAAETSTMPGTGTRSLDVNNMFPFLKDIQIEVPKTSEKINSLNNTIGNTGNSSSLASNIIVAKGEWVNIGNVANTNIDSIQLNLSQIPKDIYTYHHIVTVYESGGKKK